MSENFLGELRFFLPSPELTRGLFAAVEAARRSDQIRAREDREQTEDVEDDYLKALPPDEVSDEGAATAPASGQEEIFLQRRFIAEELYHHLAFLSRSPPARHGRALSLREAVAHGMADVFGLARDEPLLARLAGEFYEWLGGLGQFTTGWGNIIPADGERLYLEELRQPDGAAVAPPRRVSIHGPSPSRERAGGRRTGGPGDAGTG
jgi:hypothetical protein